MLKSCGVGGVVVAHKILRGQITLSLFGTLTLDWDLALGLSIYFFIPCYEEAPNSDSHYRGVNTVEIQVHLQYCQAQVQVPGQVQVRSQVRSKRSKD